MSLIVERFFVAPLRGSVIFYLFILSVVASVRGQTNLTITQQPLSQTVPFGSNLVLTVAVSGNGPLDYQWRLNGNNLPLDGIINTIAGGGSGALGDGGPATNATLVDLNNVTVDALGNVFIADTAGNQIRRVDTNGIITTFAGTGEESFYGDGGSATNATLDWPVNMAADKFGNLFIADSNNHRIRKVATNGIITTFAGNGVPTNSGDFGQATNASLDSPYGVAVDQSGNVFIADTGNGLIRRVDINGIITTIAGGGTNGHAVGIPALSVSLVLPVDIGFDGDDNFYIADASAVCKVGTNGLISSVAGIALYPYCGIAVDTYGNLFVPDGSGSQVWEMPATTNIFIDVAGNGYIGFAGDGGLAMDAVLAFPTAVALDAVGNLYIVDSHAYRVREVLNPGPILTINNPTALDSGNYDVVITGPHGSLTSSVAAVTVFGPPLITAQPQGENVAAGSNVVFSVTAAGTPPLSYQWYEKGVAVSNAVSNTLVFAAHLSDAGNFRVTVSNAYGSVSSYLATLAVPVITNQPLSQNAGLGRNFIFNVGTVGAAPYEYRWYFDNKPFPIQTNSELILSGLTLSNAGTYKVLVSNSYASVFSSSAVLAVGIAPSISQEPESVTNVAGGSLTLQVAATGAGPLTYQWSVNGTNIPTGVIATVAGTGFVGYSGQGGYSGDGGYATNAELNGPSNIVIDPLGNVLIADDQNFRVREVAPNGIITTVVGNGTYGSPRGDGGEATNATLEFPAALALATNGDLYVSQNIGSMLGGAHPYSLPVRRINPNGIIASCAGGGSDPIAENIFATNAGFDRQLSLAVDNSGDLLIGDLGYDRVRRVGVDGIINTIAGTGRSGFSGDGGQATNATLAGPYSLAVDGSGNIYVADAGNNRVREIKTNGIIRTILGGGSGTPNVGTNALLRGPTGIVLGTSGDMYIAEAQSNASYYAVVAYVASNGLVSIVAGGNETRVAANGDAATNVGFREISGMAVDKFGNLFLSDGWSDARVFKVPITGPSLNLDEFSGNKSGVYQVVVSGPYGSVTSAPAQVTIVSPPQNLAAVSSPGVGVGLTFSGTPGFSYVLQVATNLSSPINWLPVFTNEPDSGGNWSFTDTNSFPRTALFYRAMLVPP
jgi:hypothetical protein